MTKRILGDLKIRPIDFRFPDDIAVQWNPGNPGWANAFNYLCFMAPGFERYFVRAVGAALPRIHDEAVAREAALFCKQEGIHAKHHAAHIRMLVRKHPGLRDVERAITQLYDEVYRAEPLEFHLAYMCIVEATFSPLTRFVVENRERLFVDTDPRVASFFMWHMVEEYEHRGSAHRIFEHLVGSYAHKMRAFPKVARHLAMAVSVIERGLDEHVPPEPGRLRASASTGFLSKVPWSRRLVLTRDLVATLLPTHDPERVEAPEWVHEWFRAEERGEDMRIYYPTVAP